jgi:steroid 5-alpha reductase family enzyme
MTNPLMVNGVVVTLLMLTIWIGSILCRNASIVDAFWGAGFVLIAWTTFWITSPSQRSLLLPVLTTIWGMRLSLFLTWRNWGLPEDFRYRSMRDKHGSRFWLVSLLTVFVLQGLVMWIVSLPLQTSGPMAEGRTGLVVVGVLLWLLGILFEGVGDWQLARFRSVAGHQGSVLDRGLWRYTRHPNYFGDFCVWWGLLIVSLQHGAPAWSAVGPIVMSTLLMKFSGVALLEKSLKRAKPDYAAYVAATNAFFPWLPRNRRK